MWLVLERKKEIQLIPSNLNSINWCQKSFDENMGLYQVLSNVFVCVWSPESFECLLPNSLCQCNLEQQTTLFFQTSHFPDVEIFTQKSDDHHHPFADLPGIHCQFL